jgi:hypothetical protein
MRNLLLLLCFALLSSGAYAQGSFGLKPASAWKVEKLVNVISQKDHRSPGDETYVFKIDGDTLIAQVTYWKIYKTGIIYLETSTVSYRHQYFGAVREAGNKVFYIEKNKSTEQLLYDYNLNVGDVITGLVAKDHQVDSIGLLDDGRKVFYLSKSMLHAMDQIIVEGIGSSGGYFNEPPVGHYMFNDSYLVCYTEDGASKFSWVDYFEIGCSDDVSVKDQEEWNNPGILVFPNPAQKTITISAKNNLSSTKFDIYTILGKQVMTGSIGKDALTLDIEKLDNGLYLVKMKTNKGEYTQKLVVKK